jgi:hypothetical protein|tara:strand:- start:11614 stop:12231 length:618 start_codon:yes stop_codon:yes gene_type:complete
MAEVQLHGNNFEDLKIRELTGLSKKDYDSLKGKGGYTSAMDLIEGLIVDKNYSIKTAKGNKVDCGDILRRMREDNYTIIVGQWSQDGLQKIFHTEYTFNIKSGDKKKLWGDMNYDDVVSFDKFIKSIPHGKEGQQTTKEEREIRKNKISCDKALMSIHPKVDSKNQRRVQCSFKISDLIKSGIDYQAKSIKFSIESPSRTFNNKN